MDSFLGTRVFEHRLCCFTLLGYKLLESRSLKSFIPSEATVAKTSSVFLKFEILIGFGSI